MISQKQYDPVLSSGQMKTNQASIEMTAEVFDMLSSRVYKDKPLAVVREIICNARDAQVEAGVDKEVLVHIPNRLEPYLSIRDYGTGLSEERLMDMYLKYGYSDKRDSNDVIGGLGIGSKSPLAYTDSFIVKSFYDGTETTYSIHKDKGIPQVSKLTSKASTAPNGLEVKVSIRNGDYEVFRSKVESFLKYFDYPVKVVGGTIDLGTKKILDTELYTTYTRTGWHGSTIRAIMGGVVYDISKHHTEGLKKIVKDDDMLLKFDIGELSVAASRESLSEDEETIKAIEKRVKQVNDEFFKVIQTEVDATATKKEAFELLKKYGFLHKGWQDTNYKLTSIAKNLTYKGENPETSLVDLYDKSIRVVSGTGNVADRYVNLYYINKDYQFLEMDRKTGAIKLAKHLYRKNRSYVVLIEPNGCTSLQDIEDIYGKVEVKKVSELYDIEFPKSERKGKVSVAKSGLFNVHMVEIKELEEEDEGYYLPFERDVCVADGIPNNVRDSLSLKCFISLIDKMIDSKVLKRDEFYICRKGGLKAVAKTKIKELTWDVFISKLKSCYTTKDYLEYVSNNAYVSGDILYGEVYNDIWEVIKKDFPKCAKKKGEAVTQAQTTDGYNFLTSVNYGTLALIVPKIKEDIAEYEDDIKKEIDKFTKEYPIFGAINQWSVTGEMIPDLLLLVKLKNGSLKVSNK